MLKQIKVLQNQPMMWARNLLLETAVTKANSLRLAVNSPSRAHTAHTLCFFVKKPSFAKSFLVPKQGVGQQGSGEASKPRMGKEHTHTRLIISTAKIVAILRLMLKWSDSVRKRAKEIIGISVGCSTRQAVVTAGTESRQNSCFSRGFEKNVSRASSTPWCNSHKRRMQECIN